MQSGHDASQGAGDMDCVFLKVLSRTRGDQGVFPPPISRNSSVMILLDRILRYFEKIADTDLQ